MLSLFCPHIAEEFWHRLGHKSFISLEKWPIADEKKIDEKLEKQEEQAEKLAEDINHIIRILKDKSQKVDKVYIYVLPNEVSNYKNYLEFIKKKINLELSIFAVNDKNKHDPQGRAGKAKPGKPAIYIE